MINKFKFMINDFPHKEKEIKLKIIKEMIIDMIIILLSKIPFDLIKDMGLDHWKVLYKNSLYSSIWNLVFLNLYLITLICLIIFLFRSIYIKYFNKKEI